MTPVQRTMLDDHLSDAIYPRAGHVEIQSYWQKEFTRAGIDIRLLVDCCRDMLFDYEAAISDYEAAVKAKENRK